MRSAAGPICAATTRTPSLSDIIALGDFNLPLLESDDPILRALTKRGLPGFTRLELATKTAGVVHFSTGSAEQFD